MSEISPTENSSPESQTEMNEGSGDSNHNMVDIVDLAKNAISLSGLKDAQYSEEVENSIRSFLTDKTKTTLVAAIEQDNLRIYNDIASNFASSEFVYLLKGPDIEVTADNFHTSVQAGSVLGDSSIQSLLRLMNGVYAPIFFETTALPESICNDFSSRMHRFLATLTDIRYKMNGKTVLYIPEEKRVPEKVSDAIQDKELVSRLETTMIHWTRQIKEVLSAQEAVETNENDGPLEEIQFWRNRCADLSGLSKQLDLPSVKRVEKILAAAKSSYLQ